MFMIISLKESAYHKSPQARQMRPVFEIVNDVPDFPGVFSYIEEFLISRTIDKIAEFPPPDGGGPLTAMIERFRQGAVPVCGRLSIEKGFHGLSLKPRGILHTTKVQDRWDKVHRLADGVNPQASPDQGRIGNNTGNPADAVFRGHPLRYFPVGSQIFAVVTGKYYQGVLHEIPPF